MSRKKLKHGDEERDRTREMRGILDFLLQATTTTGSRVGEHLLDQENEGEAALPELPHDLEPVLIDPNVTSAVYGVVERIQPREWAAHLAPLCNVFPLPKIWNQVCQSQEEFWEPDFMSMSSRDKKSFS